MRLPTILLAVTCLAGAASAEDLSGTLQKVKETRKITLGYQEASSFPSAISTATRSRSVLRWISASRLSMP